MRRTQPDLRASVAGEAAAIYCRISQADDDDQTGVDRQERICREIAERRGLVIKSEHVYVDNSRSAWSRKRKRPGWDRLLEHARDRGFRHIIAYHPDRLMRQPRDLEELLQVSDDQAITLHGEANRRNLSDPDDRFILRIEVAHACRSSDDTSRRLKSAMEDRAREGKPQGGTRRFGYTMDGMTVVEDEAEIVREIFDRFLKGDGAAPMAHDLNRRGIKTANGKAWSAGTVRALLDSRHVASIRMHRGDEIGPGAWPAIIDAGVWEETRSRREFRTAAHFERVSQNPRHYYLLRGLVMCARCGVLMSGGSRSRHGTYRCNRSGRNDEKQCRRSVSADSLEGFVTDAAIDLLGKLQVDGQLATSNLAEETAVGLDDDQRQLAELNAMWAEKEINTADFRKMRGVIQGRISKAQRRVTIRPMVLLDGLTGSGARKAWFDDEMTDERRNAVLRFLFSGVLIEAPTKLGRFMDWDRIKIEQNPL